MGLRIAFSRRDRANSLVSFFRVINMQYDEKDELNKCMVHIIGQHPNKNSIAEML